MSELVFTTSYMDPAINCLITSFVRAINPQVAVEIGTQQGQSAILITQGMSEGSRFASFDLFESKYSAPPHSDTYANLEIAHQNIAKSNPLCQYSLHIGSYKEAMQSFPGGIDLLHVDICNHYANLYPILDALAPLVRGGMILEGGIENKWQKAYGYTCWSSILEQEWFSKMFSSLTFSYGEHNSVTLLLRRH